MRKWKRAAALLLAASVLLGLLPACGGGTRATTMHLRRTQGTVGVADGGGKSLEPSADLGLYSGYGVNTQESSYAWIDLDDVKLTKMDQNSDIGIVKEDKHLEIEVRSGSLFFNVTEPLADDETLDIHTSTMLVGIRGTCGWVRGYQSTGWMELYLLEGTVECSVGGNSATVTAGEMASMSESGEIIVAPFPESSIPGFVWEEIQDDETLLAAVADGSGDETDGPGEEESGPKEATEPWQFAYLAVLEQVRAANQASGLDQLDRATYSFVYDIDKDGTPELFVLYAPSSYANFNGRASIYTFRDGETSVVTDADGRESHTLMECSFGEYPEGNGIVYQYWATGGHTLRTLWRMENGQIRTEALGEYTSGGKRWAQYATDSIDSDDPVIRYSSAP